MKQAHRKIGTVVVIALVALAIASPTFAGKSGTVKGTIVKVDAKESTLVVKDEKGGADVTLATTERTSVAGLDRGGLLSADSLTGLEGTYVSVKWSEGDGGPVAQFVRVYPNKQS